MSVRTDVVNLNVNINGNKAQNDLNNLRKRAADIKFEMEGLRKNTQAYIDKKKELAAVNQQMAALKQQIGLTALSQKELVQELNKLKSMRGSVVPFSKEFKDLSEQIQKVESRLYDVRNGVQGFSSFFSKIKDEVKQFGALAAGYLGFQFISSQFQNIIRSGAKVSDQLADIRRVTGLTAEEVQTLNEQLKLLNTRTSTEGLRQIAIIAGKLGIAKEDIFDFTAAVDQLVVALGDELGDADQITTQLGKIINVFDKTGQVTGDNILKAGNALVSLANSGVASGGFIVDFTQRMAGLAKTANLSMEASFGLGAALEELGQRSESSSTAIIKVLGSIGKDVPKFAKLAGMSIEQFTALLRSAPEEALLRLSEALVKGKVGFDEISQAFDAAGEDGARVVTTLGVLGGKADFVRQKIREAGTALQETGEITEAFNLKNETFGATLDKLSKEFNKLVTSSTVTKFFQSVAEGALTFIRAIRNLPEFLRENRVALLTLLAGLILLNRQYIISAAVVIRDTAARWLNVIATRAGAAATQLSVIAQAAYITITNLLIGRITAATAAQRLWNLALSIGLGPVGILITLVGGLAVAMGALGGRTRALAADQRNFAEINSKITDDIGTQLQTMQRLTEVARNNNLSLETRQKALNELIKLNPEYLKGLTLENLNYQEGISILGTYSLMLQKVAQDKARLALNDDLVKELERLKLEQPQLEVDNANSSVLNPFDRSDKRLAENLQRQKQIRDQLALNNAQIKGSIQGVNDLIRIETARLNNLKKGSAEYQQQLVKIDALNRRLGVLLGAPAGTVPAAGAGGSGGDTGGGGSGGTGGGGAPTSNKGEHLKKELEQWKQEVERLRRELEAGGKSADEQEIQRIEDKYAELLDKAKKYNFAVLEIEGFRQKELEAAFQRQFQKRFETETANEYEASLQANADYYQQLRKQAALNYANGIVSKQQYEQTLRTIEKNETQDRITIAGDYSGIVKKAAEDVTRFKKAQEQQQTADMVAETDKRIAQTEQEQLARARRAVLTTRPGTSANLQAQKDELQLRFELETQFMDKRSELYLMKQAELNTGLEALDNEFNRRRLEQVLAFADMAAQAMASLHQIMNNMDQRALNRERQQNRQKETMYRRQLDNKLISQAVFDKRMEELNAAQEASQREANRRRAKREKALGIFTAIINTAAAVIKMLADPGGVAGVALSIAAGITGGLQIAAIASQPLPELARGKWFKKGKTHKEGGIPVEIEKNEAVMSAGAMTDPNVYTVTGTAAQITSALNSRNGGVSWASGATLLPQWVTAAPATINSSVPAMMQQGGFAGNNSSQPAQDLTPLFTQMILAQKENTDEIRNMKTRLHAVVSIKEFREEEEIYDAAINASRLKQTNL